MRKVQVYINDEILDLFNDEKIVISSSVKNIADISKVYSDFSQTFTVPASKRNNKIFGYYYNNDLDVFKAKKRQPARIEINQTPFKKGNIQLESSEIKNGEVQSYTITFFGEITTLKDLFADDKLKDLQYDLEFERTFANVVDTIANTNDLDIRFPLVSSEVVWTYGTSGVGDISNSTQAIDYTKLFPAVKVAKVFEAIENTYGVSFSGNFLNDKRFTELFTWWKHNEKAVFPTSSRDLEFDLSTSVNSTYSIYPIVDEANKVHIQFINPNNGFIPLPSPTWVMQNGVHRIGVSVSNTSTNDDYFLDVYKNGVLIQSHLGQGNVNFTPAILGINYLNVFGLNEEFEFKLRASDNFTFNFNIYYLFDYQIFDTSSGQTQNLQNNATDTVTGVIVNPFIDFNLTAPDIKVSEFFSGILKMFNLTCYPLTDKFDFQIETIDSWYEYGDFIDITEFVDVTSIKVERPKLFNSIDFSYQESKSFTNENFNDNNNRHYGSLKENFGYDGGDFNINLPFENLLFNKFTSTNLQVAYSLTNPPDFKPYVPKPVVMYLMQKQTLPVSFWITDGTTPQNITSYLPYGSELLYNNDYYSINFNQEISSLTLQGVSNSLYLTYYLKYLSNLYDDKTRIVTVKTILPIRLLNYIELNDSVIIRDKRYLINDMKADLTTGEVELVLITDFRSKFGNGKSITVNSDNNIINVDLKPVKKELGGNLVLSGELNFTEVNKRLPYTMEGEEIITLTIAKNTTGLDRVDTLNLRYNLPNGKSYDTTLTIIQLGYQANLTTENNFFLITENGNKIVI